MEPEFSPQLSSWKRVAERFSNTVGKGEVAKRDKLQVEEEAGLKRGQQQAGEEGHGLHKGQLMHGGGVEEKVTESLASGGGIEIGFLSVQILDGGGCREVLYTVGLLASR